MEPPTRAALRTPSSSTQPGAFKSPDLTQATPTPAHTLDPPPASPCPAPSAASGWACHSLGAPPLGRVQHSRLPPLPWRGSPPPRPAPPFQARGPAPPRLAPPTFPPVNGSGFRLSSGLRDNAAFAAWDWKPRASPEPAAAALKSALRIVGVSRPPVDLRFGATPRPRRRVSSGYLNKTNTVTLPEHRQNGRLLVLGPKEKMMIEPSEAVSKNKVSTKIIENKISQKNIDNNVSTKSTENKDAETNLRSKLRSFSFLRKRTGEMSKDVTLAELEKNDKYSHQKADDKVSESTDDAEDTNDENDEDDNSTKETHAPLELMAEFLRAEMGQDYHLAKQLCHMILMYEPENPEVKEFLSVIEEMLLMEKVQSHEESEESEEDSNSESEGESSEDPSDDECEDN
ncbi:glutamate-rich protein 2 [Suncus etruscus]|uniref:glutamate-rich protein 2 n=1 Tax=Suncus etruscus TaxID=109475 RepID=UPI002110527B|nr:glutamate-rich protein 2 [Suncus etruscus]